MQDTTLHLLEEKKMWSWFLAAQPFEIPKYLVLQIAQKKIEKEKKSTESFI